MIIGVLYFFIIIGANTIGAVSGMGGGVIIKPIFDFVGAHSVSAISFYSTVAVFVMSLVSTVRQVREGRQFDKRWLILIATGAVLGGVLGNVSFTFLLELVGDAGVQLVQILLTIVSLLFALGYSFTNNKGLELKHLSHFFLCGSILGFLASLLGIGGGPINVSLLMLMFSMTIKEAAVYSLGTIFFSQAAKIAAIIVAGGIASYDLEILVYVIPAAIIGGLIGAKLSGILSTKKVTFVFQTVVLLVLAINLYNGFAALT